MKRGDVVIVVAPGEFGKPRPAVIVQADELGDRSTSIIVCPLSSAVARAGRIRPVIEPTPANRLRERSQIMTDKITRSVATACAKPSAGSIPIKSPISTAHCSLFWASRGN